MLSLGVYAALVERKRRRVARYGHLAGSPYRGGLARLEAGEPVEDAAAPPRRRRRTVAR
jgi:hypothetical protein